MMALAGQAAGHVPVLYNAVMAGLLGTEPGCYVDATFGAGGHTRGILEAHADNSVLAIDCDPAAAERAAAFKAEFGQRFEFVAANFEILAELDCDGFAGILFDFGVSSYHLDEAERGFSFRADGPLDMRLNPLAGRSAAQFLEEAPHAALVEAVRDFGEERKWRRVVAAIESARGTGALARTLSFAALVTDAMGGRRPWDKIHPATQTFQGVRIAVNRELAVIERALPAAFERLASGGRLAAISFHSLEDRIVKRLFRRWAGRPEHRGDTRNQEERTAQAWLPSAKAIVADAAECAANPRSRSARLRILEKGVKPAKFKQRKASDDNT